VDVVHQELDVSRVAEGPDQQSDGRTDGDEHCDLRDPGVLLGPEHPLEDVEDADVGGPDQASPEAHEGDEPNERAIEVREPGVHDETS
jgi:hypothetical protein